MQFDTLVIGTGTSGHTLALALRKAGQSVAVVDNRPYGGTCAMRGCQPKKYLVMAAEVAHLAQQMSKIGINPVAKIDWPALMRSKTEFTGAVPANTEEAFSEAGIIMLRGTAQFIADDTVQLDGDAQVRARTFVIATGARPAPLGFEGEELAATSDDFLELPAMPRRILFVGGGYISMEFAHVARAAGAEVTVLHRGERVLKNFESEVVDQLTASARAFGINVVTNYQACCLEKTESGYVVRGNTDCATCYEADLIVHGAGRVANIEALNLDRGGIAHSPQGVTINEYLQSVSNPRVFAIGDASSTPLQLATTADMQAAAAAENIISGNVRAANYSDVPSVVFTLPPMASVGMTEAAALKSDARFHINRGSMAGWASSRRIGQKHAFYKVLIDDDSGRILGAHLFGHNAGEAINVFALAMKFGHTNRELRQVLWAYPTHTSDLKYMIA